MRKYLIVKVQEIPDNIIEAAAMLSQPHFAVFWIDDKALDFLKKVNDAGIILKHLPGGRPATATWTPWTPGSEMPNTLRGMYLKCDDDYPVEDEPSWQIFYAHDTGELSTYPDSELIETLAPGMALDYTNNVSFFTTLEQWNVEVETETIPLDELLKELSKQTAIEMKVVK